VYGASSAIIVMAKDTFPHRMHFKLTAVLLFLLSIQMTFAQGDCAPLVSAAVQSTLNACANTMRNFACYGSAPAEARARMGAGEPVFTQPGDMADLSIVRRLTVGVNETGWGVALMRVQANLPDTPPDQNVTMVTFGDVVITNTGTQALAPITLTAVAVTGANIRALPTDDAAILASLLDNQTAQVVGRLSDSSWLQIMLPDGLQATGWVFAELLRVDGDVNMLAVVDPNVPQYSAMQAFRFHSLLVDTGCAPQSGILIQTPEGAGRVLLSINNVNVRLGSTAFVQAVEGGLLNFYVLQGSALLDAQGGGAFVPAGTRVTVQLNTDGLAAAPPSVPLPYDEALLNALPLVLLPEAITAAPSLTAEQIATLRSTGEMIPPPPPTGSAWTNTASLMSDTCGGASTDSQFTVTMVFSSEGTLTHVVWNDLVFKLRTAEGAYVGTAVWGDAQYTLDLTLTSATTYSGTLTVNFAFSPTCAWRFQWEGSAAS
jgi:hypothetical protein